MQPQLKYNCSKKWDELKIGLIERHCDHCNKHVHDFTSMSREEIYQFFLEHQNEKICGRILPSQLDYRHEQRLIIIDELLKVNRNNNMAFYFLALGGLTLLSCNDSGDNGKNLKSDTIIDIIEKRKKGDTCTLNHNHIINDSAEYAVMGDMSLGVYSENDTITNENPVVVVEVMPEFKGGYDSLLAYIKSNTKYPEWERKNNITGTVYVSFVIDKYGKVTKPKIRKTVKEAKNFDSVVLDIINKMPDWKAGRQGGHPVPVEMTIPIKFSLK